jgi:hypothetical protein
MVYNIVNSDFGQVRGKSSLAANPLASQEGLCSTELDILSQEDDAAFGSDGVNLNESFRKETRAMLANCIVVPHVSPPVASH